MNTPCKLVKTSSEKMNNITLHNNILDLLFTYKNEIHKKLSDVRGAFLIDHFSIKIFDPKNKMVIFSLTPSVEYNLIVQGLWKYDKSFNPHSSNYNELHFWDNCYSETHFKELKNIKEHKHGFTFGFNLIKKIESFYFIYSFATRSKNDGLQEYYQHNKKELLNLGDYSYRMIRDIYVKCCNPNYIAPNILNSNPYQKKPILQLIPNKIIK